MGLALEEPAEEDIVETINGIKVAFEKAVYSQTEGLTLEAQDTPQGKGLVMQGSGSDCC
ncbi:hypothetical protein HNQ41_002199 [Texcoconibacillus texcoconensis]|nr:hypothetical protein [Texcoconibacillus texcoconensis]MBB5174009.1 hypothetical protein [Texcoconibacillus texcoconensis]